MTEMNINNKTRLLTASVVSLFCLMTSAFMILPAQADDHGGGHDKGGSKPKINFIIGPVTKTHDPKGQGSGGGHH
jgi:hypothetical protein